MSEKLQKQQQIAGCLLSHIAYQQDHVDFIPLTTTLVAYLESRTQQPLISCVEQLKSECQQRAIVTVKKRVQETEEETVPAAVKAPRVSPIEGMTIVASDASASTITMAETVAGDATVIASRTASGERTSQRIVAVANSVTSNRATRSRLTDLLEIVSGITEIIDFTSPSQRDQIITNILANLPTTYDYDLSYQVVYGKNQDLNYEIDGYWGASLELLLKNGAAASYILSRVIIEILLSEDWVKRLEAEFNQPTFMGILADELSIATVLKDYQLLNSYKDAETLGFTAKRILPLTAKFIIFKLLHRMVANFINYKCTVENSSSHLLVNDRKQQLYYEENLHKYFLAQFHDQLTQEQTVLIDLTPYFPLIELLCRPGGRSIAFKFDALRWKTEVFGRLYLDLTWLEYAVFENIAANVNLLVAQPLSLQWLVGFLKAGRNLQAEQFFEKNKSVIIQDLSRITALELFLLITTMPISMRCSYLLKVDSVLDVQHPLKETLRRFLVLYNNPQPEGSANANLADFFVKEVKSLAMVRIVISLCSPSVRYIYFESLKQFVTNSDELKDIIVLFDPSHRLIVTRMMSHISMSALEAIWLEEYMPNRLEFLLSYIDDITVHPGQSIDIHRVCSS